MLAAGGPLRGFLTPTAENHVADRQARSQGVALGGSLLAKVAYLQSCSLELPEVAGTLSCYRKLPEVAGT